MLIVEQLELFEGVLVRGAISGGNVSQNLPGRVYHPCPDNIPGFIGSGGPLTTGDPNHGKYEKGKQDPGQDKFQTIHHDISLKTISSSRDIPDKWGETNGSPFHEYVPSGTYL
jgi:hypothetical protein